MISCPACHTKQSPEFYNQPGFFPCPGCGSELRLLAFPALNSRKKTLRAEEVRAEDESSCFYHPDKKAVHSCAFCGRFLCGFCDLPFAGQHLCPSCLSNGKDATRVLDSNKGQLRYDRLALALAVLSMLFYPITVITAPLALYLCLRYFRRELSLVPVHRWRFALAGVIALLQLGGWTLVLAKWMS